MTTQDSPFFSIIIPTRSRSYLLKHAIRGILNQTFTDYEIVISDNNSKDDTKSLVKSFNSEKVRYVETGKDLNLVDSWNFAIKQGKGRYIYLHADDDCLIPNALETIYNNIITYGANNFDYITIRGVWYCHNGSKKGSNVVKLNKLLKTHVEDCKNGLKNFLSFKMPCNRTNYYIVRNEYIKETSDIHSLPFPDYFATTKLLLNNDKVLNIGDICFVHGYAKESIGEIATGKREKLDWPEIGKDFEVNTPFTNVPLKGYFFINGWAESMLRVLKEEKKENDYDINWEQYFIKYYSQLIKEGEWRNIESDLAEYYSD